MTSQRYVILVHDHPFLHWDLMLEQGGALRTWRLHAEPTCIRQITAEPLSDHRLAYLEYEGPVSNDRGVVSQWDYGTYSLQQKSDTVLDLQFSGKVLNGRASLSEQSDESWIFCYPA